MNPLGNLPQSTSEQFTLNWLDLLKILRMLLVVAVGAIVTNVLPHYAQLTYVYQGVDLTLYVQALITAAIEAGRRFVSGSTPTGG